MQSTNQTQELQSVNRPPVFCTAVQPGRRNAHQFGCVRLAGHVERFHINGMGEMWIDHPKVKQQKV